MKRVALGFGLALLVLVVLAGTQPQLFEFVHRIPYGDKVGHFTLMGFFSLLVNLAMGCAPLRPGRKWLLKGSAVVALLVTLEEFSQIFVVARTFSLLDLSADFLGILTFGELARRLHRRGRVLSGR